MGKQLDTVKEKCKIAYMAKVPIIYLVTDDYKLTDDLIRSGCLCEFLYQLRRTDFVYSDDGTQLMNDDGTPKTREVELYLTEREMKEAGEPIDAEPVNFSSKSNWIYSMSGEFPSAKHEVPQIGLVKNFDVQNEINHRAEKNLTGYVYRYMTAPANSYIRKSVMILTGTTISIPAGLESYIEVVEVPPLDEEEIKEVIKGFEAVEASKYGYSLSTEFLNQLVVRLKGFEKHKITEILTKIKAKNGFLCDEGGSLTATDQTPKRESAYSYIKAEKEQILKKTGILSYTDTDEAVRVGGLKNMLDWIDERNKILQNYETATEQWHLTFSKGLLVAGVPGCGKSLMAKKTAQILNVPLIRMDVGALQSSYHGQSEANMRKATQLAEAMAPCVLWIDEIEKAFAGTKGGGESDGGTSQRAFASFLTWLQEKKKPVFAFITSNDISKLPSELLRLGRVSKKYCISMPTESECIDIFKECIKKLSGDSNGLFDTTISEDAYISNLLSYCAEQGKFLTGADISEILSEAMTKYFLKYGAVSSQPGYSSDRFGIIVREVIDSISPYGKTNLDDIVKFQLLQEKNNFEYAADEQIISLPLSEEAKDGTKVGRTYDERLKAAIVNTYKTHNF